MLTLTLTSSNFSVLRLHSNASKKVIDKQCTFMLFLCVFANQNLRLWSAFPRRCHPSVRPEVLFLQTFRRLDLLTFRRLPFRHRDEKRVTCRDFRPFFSYACTLFHFPYPLTPLFATLTKTTGVYPNNSPLPSEKQPLCFYALTNCSPRNSFLLTFMHHMGGVWGYPYLPIEVPAQLGSRDPDPVRTFRHSNVPRSLVCPACPDSVGKPVGVTVPLLPPVTSHSLLHYFSLPRSV